MLHDRRRSGRRRAAFGAGSTRSATIGGDPAADLQAAYLTSAMQAPDRAAEAHRRADGILAAEPPASRAERELASKAMVMRLWSGAPRSEVLAVAGRLSEDGAADARADSRALVHVAGCLSVCDDYPAADAVLRRMFAAARRQGSASAFAAASQLRARQRLWTGPVPDAVLDARAAVDVWRGGLQMYVHQATYCLVTGLLEQDEPDAAERALALAEHEPAPTGFFAAWRHTAIGRVAAHRGTTTPRWRRSSPPGGA